MEDVGDVRQWRFRHRLSGDERIYEQRELSIDGEAQMFRFLAMAVRRLKEAEFPFARIGEVFPETEEDLAKVPVDLVAEMAGVLFSEAPELLTEAAAIMLGVYPFERGKRNRVFTEEVTFLRQSMHLADAIEMFLVFTEQNDIGRLKRPFSAALTRFGGTAMEAMALATATR
jgi:hypothetical protein